METIVNEDHRSTRSSKAKDVKQIVSETYEYRDRNW